MKKKCLPLIMFVIFWFSEASSLLYQTCSPLFSDKKIDMKVSYFYQMSQFDLNGNFKKINNFESNYKLIKASLIINTDIGKLSVYQSHPISCSAGEGDWFDHYCSALGTNVEPPWVCSVDDSDYCSIHVNHDGEINRNKCSAKFRCSVFTSSGNRANEGGGSCSVNLPPDPEWDTTHFCSALADFSGNDPNQCSVFNGLGICSILESGVGYCSTGDGHSDDEKTECSIFKGSTFDENSSATCTVFSNPAGGNATQNVCSAFDSNSTCSVHAARRDLSQAKCSVSEQSQGKCSVHTDDSINGKNRSCSVDKAVVGGYCSIIHEEIARNSPSFCSANSKTPGNKVFCSVTSGNDNFCSTLSGSVALPCSAFGAMQFCSIRGTQDWWEGGSSCSVKGSTANKACSTISVPGSGGVIAMCSTANNSGYCSVVGSVTSGIASCSVLTANSGFCSVTVSESGGNDSDAAFCSVEKDEVNVQCTNFTAENDPPRCSAHGGLDRSKCSVRDSEISIDRICGGGDGDPNEVER